MAMNKTEQKRVADLERDIAWLKALSWPHYAMPASMTYDEIKANLVEGGLRHGRPQMVAKGFAANAYQDGRVSPICSNGVNHGHGDTTTTQGMGRLFANEADAWRVLRLELTERYASNLARIDAEIARCTS